MALKPMKNFDRYGVVEINEQNKVLRFNEKKKYAEGLINGGVYMLNLPAFLQKDWPEIFSFEKDFLENSSKIEMVIFVCYDLENYKIYSDILHI